MRKAIQFSALLLCGLILIHSTSAFLGLGKTKNNDKSKEQKQESTNEPAQYEKMLRQPLQLVRPDSSHNGLEVVEENLQYLAGINEPVSIIAVIGPYHSGKSFLLNSFLHDTKGFRVGPSVNPETKGIWMMKTDYVASDNSRVVLLDTEGFFGSDVAEAYDAKMFAIVTLLSSHLVYNSIKVIDQQSVDYLELLARRTQLFQLRNTAAASTNISGELLDILHGANFPALTWVVKDFAQNLETNANDWLFEYIRGHRDKEIKGNELDKVFNNGINAHTMFLPAIDHEKLQDLSKTSLSDLTPEFRQDLLKLQETILNNLKAKSTTRGSMNGATLASLLRFLILSANENRIPQLPSLWESWVKQQVDVAMEDAIASYKREISEILNSEQPPSESQFPKLHKKAMESASQLYKDMLFGQENIYGPNIKKLEQQLEDQFNDLKDANRYHVRDTMLKYKNDLVNRALRELGDIELPAEESKINEKYDELLQSVKSLFNHNMKPYEGSSDYNDLKNSLLNELTAKRDNLLLNNKKQIGDLLDKAYDDYVSTYERNMRDVKDVATNPNELERQHLASMNLAQIKFDMDIHHLRKQWIKYDKDYKGRLALAQQHAENVFDTWKVRNEELIQKKADDLVDKYTQQFEKSLKEIQPFPDDEYKLVDKSTHSANHLIEEYNANMGDFTPSTVFAKKRDELKRNFVEDFADYLDHNIKATKALSGDVFLCAKQRLHDTLESRRFSLAKIWPWAHQQAAIKAAEECFALDSKANSLPNTMKYKVINEWYKSDLNNERWHTYNNLLKSILTAVIGLIGFGYLAMKLAELMQKSRPQAVVVVAPRRVEEVHLIEKKDVHITKTGDGVEITEDIEDIAELPEGTTVTRHTRRRERVPRQVRMT